MSAPTGMRVGAATVLLLAALALVLVIVVAWAAGGRAEFGPRPFSDVEAALVGGGIEVCAVSDAPDPQANQAVATRTLTVAEDCTSSELAEVVADRYADAEDRDAAVRAHEVVVRPRAAGVVYTWGDMSLLLRGDGQTVDRAGDALLAAGAR